MKNITRSLRISRAARLVFPVVFICAALTACAGNLVTEGDSLEPVIAAGLQSVGKIYTLTLDQINIERDDTGAYIRLFDKQYETLFLYVPALMNDKVLNLKVDDPYIFKFRITVNDKSSTLSGELLEVAGPDGKPVSGTRIDREPSACSLILAGPAAHGSTVTLNLVYTGKSGDAENTISLWSPDDYEKQVFLAFGTDPGNRIDGLVENEKYRVTFKVDDADWRVFGTLISIE
jgi:hypothetical protein